MILLLDTSTPICKLWLYDGDTLVISDEWEAGRELAEKLLGYLKGHLDAQNKTWDDLTGVGVFQGPGSFTGLRIGMAVLNTIASDRSIAIVGATGEDWREDALGRLLAGENDQIVLPEYGRDANITLPRK